MPRPLITRPGQTPSAAGRLIPPSDHETVTNAPTGFPNRTDSTISFVAGTRTFTITPASGAFSHYIAGRRYTISAADSIVIADTSGIHMIYYDGATLTVAINPSHATFDDLILNKVLVAAIYWNATDGAEHVSGDERHGCVMSAKMHEWLHDHIGTIWHPGGLDLSGYTLATDNDAALTFELTDGAIDNEDIQHDIVDGAPATQYAQQLSAGDAEIPVLHRDDVDGSWTEVAASTLPYLTTGTGRLARNNNDGDGTYSQVEIANNKFVNFYLYGTNDWVYPIKMIQGQAEHADQATAVEAVNTDVAAFGALPSPAAVLLYAFTMQTNTGFGGAKKAKIVAVQDFRRLSLSGGAAIPGQVHPILSTTHSDSVAAAVVRGDIQVGNATPAWERLAKGSSGTFLRSGVSDVAWDGTVVTSGAVFADNAVLRGDGLARGAQKSGVIISDADAMSGLTQLNVDNLRLDGDTISGTGTSGIIFQPLTGRTLLTYVTGTPTSTLSAWSVYNYAWNAAMTDTRTSLAFLQAYAAGGVGSAADISGVITVGTETNWGAAAATRDSYMAFFTTLDGTPSEKLRISSTGNFNFMDSAGNTTVFIQGPTGEVGIGTTDPGAIFGARLAIHNNARSAIALFTFSNTATTDSRLFACRARGTEGSEVVVQDNDRLFFFQALGWAPSGAFRTAAYIEIKVDGTPASTTVPGSIGFWTTTTSSPSLRMTIQSDGDILVDSGTSVFVRDSGLGFNSSVDGQLDVFADVECEITAPTVDLTASTAVIVRNVHGINYAPGSDTDTDIYTVDVDGNPTGSWDESMDVFNITHGIQMQDRAGGDTAEPAIGSAALYLKQSGGKTTLAIRFNNGGGAADVVEIAQEN